MSMFYKETVKILSKMNSEYNIFIPIIQRNHQIELKKEGKMLYKGQTARMKGDKTMSVIQEMSEFLQKGRAKNVKALVQQALDEGIDPKEILNEGLLGGMMIIGAKFKNNEVFVPEVLVAARAMNAGLMILEPKLVEIGNEPVGKAVIATVQGDLHDIGKNLVSMMIKGAGFEIHDLGIDVPASDIIDKAEEVGADIICMSALLTTTMPKMEECIQQLKERGLRDKYVVMIGGAPVTDNFAQQIGADFYTPDASTAAEVAKKAVLDKK